MKTIQKIIVMVFVMFFIHSNAQEKKIKFNKGTLKICSSKNFQIEGYDGDEVIIKSLHEKRNSNLSYVVTGYSSSSRRNLSKIGEAKTISSNKKTDSIKSNNYVFFNTNPERKKGLKKLGKNMDNESLGIYFTIEKKGDELIFKDKSGKSLVLVSNEKYEVKIPNSISIKWLSSECSSNKKKADNKYIFFSSDASSISNFKGEVQINSSMRNTKLVDVTGPVSLNSLGGNFTIIFNKQKPNKLYSVYSNNGFIDVTLPKESSLNVLAVGKSIFSDLDFKVISEKELNDFGHVNQEMRLKLNSGSVKMSLNAGFGNVYLRKK